MHKRSGRRANQLQNRAATISEAIPGHQERGPSKARKRRNKRGNMTAKLAMAAYERDAGTSALVKVVRAEGVEPPPLRLYGGRSTGLS